MSERGSAARKAANDEWNRLRTAKGDMPPCWDENAPRPKAEVIRESRESNITYHFGRLFEIIVEKGSEQELGTDGRKYKGRVVFQGNNVKDENNDFAVFSELSSSPATMEAGKFCDAYGLLPGHTSEQADATQAYTQSFLKGAAGVWGSDRVLWWRTVLSRS